MTSKERVLAIEPNAMLSHVPQGAGDTYGRTRWHYHVWREVEFGKIETLAYVECYGKSEASAWKTALSALKANGDVS